MAQAAERALGLVAAEDWDSRLADWQWRGSLLWQLFIVGEACARLTRDAPDVAERITEVEGVVAFRNLLAHGYDRIKRSKLDSILRHALPRLHAEALELLEELDPGGTGDEAGDPTA